jgi:hypothetical protein
LGHGFGFGCGWLVGWGYCMRMSIGGLQGDMEFCIAFEDYSCKA